MGVYVKSMKMPELCAECNFWDRCPKLHAVMRRDDDYEWTFEDLIDAKDDIGILNDCPLVEVPEPHGDLIDKARLMMHVADSYLSKSVTKEEMNLVEEFVTMARIVIEAEVE